MDSGQRERIQHHATAAGQVARCLIMDAGRPREGVQGVGIVVFGVAKRQAAEALAAYGRQSGASVANVVLPNIFGEWGTPFYNSVVATFSHQLALGETPRIEVDKQMPLLHVQRAAEVLLSAAQAPVTGRIASPAPVASVTDVLERLITMSTDYRTGDLPDLADPFTLDLFNTYRSYTFPQSWPLHPQGRGDQLGELRDGGCLEERLQL